MPPSKLSGDSTPVLLARVEEKLDHLTEQVDDIKSKLYGNGRPGIILDQETQNNNIEKLLQTAKINSDNIAKLVPLAAPTWIARHWKSIVLSLLTFFIVIHSLIPADLSLWTVITKFLGGG